METWSHGKRLQSDFQKTLSNKACSCQGCRWPRSRGPVRSPRPPPQTAAPAGPVYLTWGQVRRVATDTVKSARAWRVCKLTQVNQKDGNSFIPLTQTHPITKRQNLRYGKPCKRQLVVKHVCHPDSALRCDALGWLLTARWSRAAQGPKVRRAGGVQPGFSEMLQGQG